MAANKAKFLDGDLMRHIIVMALSASAGLVSIFLVDFVDLYFISLLGQKELTAAVGFAGTLIFITISVNIGLMIAMSALAARRIGRGEEAEARRIATSVIAVGLCVSILIAALFWVNAPQLISLLGAAGETQDYAVRYLRIVTLGAPISTLAMVMSGLLRAHGDARRAMNAILAAGAVNAILDPILIFGFGMGLDGAAYASLAAPFAMLATAARPIMKYYGGFAGINFVQLRKDLSPIFAIAGPAILTNVATPFGAAIVTRAIAPFGDAAVASYAVIGRLTPLVFCVIFALSGAVGPIIGQNFGAGRYDRARETLRKAVIFTGAYTLGVWALMILSYQFITEQFGVVNGGRTLIFWFAMAVTPLFFFNGVLFIANAAFNNLNRPIWSTMLNWGKNTIGVAPFVFAGAALAGAPGVLIGQAIGGIVFSVLGLWLAFRLIASYSTGALDPEKGWKINFMRARVVAPPPAGSG